VYIHLGRGDFITFLNKKKYKTDNGEEEEENTTFEMPPHIFEMIIHSPNPYPYIRINALG